MGLQISSNASDWENILMTLSIRNFKMETLVNVPYLKLNIFARKDIQVSKMLVEWKNLSAKWLCSGVQTTKLLQITDSSLSTY